MNKALIILSLFMCVKLSAQSEKESLSIFDKHNEVRIGVIKILAGPIFEGTYEYVKNMWPYMKYLILPKLTLLLV